MRGVAVVGSGPKVPRRGDLRACSATAAGRRLEGVAHPRRAQDDRVDGRPLPGAARDALCRAAAGRGPGPEVQEAGRPGVPRLHHAREAAGGLSPGGAAQPQVLARRLPRGGRAGAARRDPGADRRDAPDAGGPAALGARRPAASTSATRCASSPGSWRWRTPPANGGPTSTPRRRRPGSRSAGSRAWTRSARSCRRSSTRQCSTRSSGSFTASSRGGGRCWTSGCATAARSTATGT